MKRRSAELIARDPERFFHHDRVFLNNPVVMQGMGLAPLVVQGIFDIIRTINQQGVTVLLIEQNANMALKIADWAYVMQTGSILMQGPGEELAANEEVKAAYLGTAK